MSGLGTVGRWVQEGSVYGVLLLLPFSKAAVEIGFGFLLLGWLLERVDPSTRGQTVWGRRGLRPILMTLAAFLAVCVLSILVSDHRSLSVRGFIRKWLEYALFFVIAADLGRRPGVVQRSALVLVASSFLVVIEALSQELLGKGLLRGFTLLQFGYGRMTGPYENPIDLATFFMVVIPICLALSVGQGRLRRVLVWGNILLAVLCLARTRATGAWCGLGIGLAVLMMVSRTLWHASAIVLAITIFWGGVFLVTRENLRNVLSLFSDLGVTDRWAMWQAALGMIRDRPLLGHGVNTFMANYLTYWVGGERQPRYAHNCYLQVAAETGLVGLLAFGGLLGALFARVGDGVRRLPRDERVILGGILGGLVAFAFQAGIDTNFYALRHAVLFWVLAGLAVGFAESPHDEELVGRT